MVVCFLCQIGEKRKVKREKRGKANKTNELVYIANVVFVLCYLLFFSSLIIWSSLFYNFYFLNSFQIKELFLSICFNIFSHIFDDSLYISFESFK
jgi:hypothetical protein